MKLGLRLRFLREQKGLSGREVGERIGVTKNMISLYETDKVEVPWSRLEALAEVYGTTAESIITGVGNDTIKDNNALICDLEYICTGMNEQKLKILITMAKELSALGKDKNKDGSDDRN